MALRAWCAATVAIVVAAATPAHADDDDDDRPIDIPLIIGEELLVFVPPVIWYWRTAEHQAVDWELGWDWDSWEKKLTFEKVLFDTNPFFVNAVRHPAKGVLDYHIARANGFGMTGATVFATVMGAAWEYVVEYREDPSINDLIFNTAGGIAIGEPLWQFGQLWRGGRLTYADRARTALFAPFDAIHDTVRVPHRWWRPRAWRSFELAAGAGTRRFADTARSELLLDADFEVIADPAYLADGPRSGATPAGAWNRVHARVRFADTNADKHMTGSYLHSRTSLVGHYAQDGAGNSRFVGLGTAFTFDKEALPHEWDKLAVAHLLGPQIELAHRGPGYVVRWEGGAYGDFALVQAHVFGPDPPFPPAPPYRSTLQANGYYDGFGASALTRLRADTRYLGLDIEVTMHEWWQIGGADRDSVEARVESEGIPATPQDSTDERVFWRAALVGHPSGRWSVAGTLEGAYRRGTWRDLDRRTAEHTVGLLLQVAL